MDGWIHDIVLLILVGVHMPADVSTMLLVTLVLLECHGCRAHGACRCVFGFFCTLVEITLVAPLPQCFDIHLIWALTLVRLRGAFFLLL